MAAYTGAMVPTSRLVRNRRATKREVDGRDIEEVVAELLVRECSVQGFVAAIRERLVRRILLDDPANEGLVPWGPTDEAAHDDAQILGLPATASTQQGAAVGQLDALGASAAPPSANIGSLAGPQNARAGGVASPPSSDSMRGLGGMLQLGLSYSKLIYCNSAEDRKSVV